ncbi:MAG: Dam family site-specific DNA-(adenine-N6)-methyltransferase [Alteraurantiacibacter sp.]
MQFNFALQDEFEQDEPQLASARGAAPFKSQLLKWIGNKQRFAHEIIGFFPDNFEVYHEPFLGSGAVLGTLAPKKAEASDAFEPLVEIWQTLSEDPARVKRWYRDRWTDAHSSEPKLGYEKIKACFNRKQNGADLLYLSRSCYGGVVRFRQRDGFMSTPCGPHKAMHPDKFDERVDEWSRRTKGTRFFKRDFSESIDRAGEGDVVYCDPPYSHSQTILYGAQRFDLEQLFKSIESAKRRGAFVALSIDGTKKSGDQQLHIEWPRSVFAREVSVNVGRSMLRRLQMNGQTLEAECVTDRLLLTH